MNFDQPGSCSKLLVGRRLLSVEKKEWTWFFAFDGDTMLTTESPWRLAIEGQVRMTSEDDGHQFGHSEPVDAETAIRSGVVGRHVEAASICPTSGDLTIDFSGRTQLQLLQMSSGYEAWRLSSREGETICLGGGRLAQLPSR